ncbi:ribosomal protein S18 acetylase RimI-like enzyme [Paenibacillus methanolicus]|uniref:Ribosomal protein S18 acetylase RimI-like enzyme n=2 Tax=Paenibacillus methanolicus TaxID=582686 RepID=A0A5S5BUQ8_9BACL|nr:ribosomal protein S18 acetylase RimI-like enzyme [Paenibacillus methanolicus]
MRRLRAMEEDDYDAMIELWRGVDGLELSGADSREGIAKYLARNPGMSFVAEAEGRIVGTVLGGHDGRRGFINHLAVDPACRGQRIGAELTERCLGAIAADGIGKCHIFVKSDNEIGKGFWARTGWSKRSGFDVFSRDAAVLELKREEAR